MSKPRARRDNGLTFYDSQAMGPGEGQTGSEQSKADAGSPSSWYFPTAKRCRSRRFSDMEHFRSPGHHHFHHQENLTQAVGPLPAKTACLRSCMGPCFSHMTDLNWPFTLLLGSGHRSRAGRSCLATGISHRYTEFLTAILRRATDVQTFLETVTGFRHLVGVWERRGAGCIDLYGFT